VSQRRCPIIELNLSQIESLIRPALTNTVVSFELMTQGAINSNYKVTLDNGKNILLRLYGQQTPGAEGRNRVEADVISLVADRVPVAEILYAGNTCDDRLIGLIDQGIGGKPRPYAILKWCEGILLQQLLDGGKYLKSRAYLTDVMAAVGETLAAIGSYKFARSGFFAANLKIDQTFGSDASEYLHSCLANDLVQTRLGADLHKRLGDYVDAGALELNQYLAGEETTLVHGDFNALNILVTENRDRWCVSAVLDWEFAHAGTKLFDIGNFLRQEQKYPGMTAAFIAGYETSGAKLPQNSRQMARYVDLNSLLEFLTIAEARQELFAKTIANIEQTLAQKSCY